MTIVCGQRRRASSGSIKIGSRATHNDILSIARERHGSRIAHADIIEIGKRRTIIIRIRDDAVADYNNVLSSVINGDLVYHGRKGRRWNNLTVVYAAAQRRSCPCNTIIVGHVKQVIVLIVVQILVEAASRKSRARPIFAADIRHINICPWITRAQYASSGSQRASNGLLGVRNERKHIIDLGNG